MFLILLDQPDQIQHFERALEDQRDRGITSTLGNLNDAIIEDYAD